MMDNLWVVLLVALTGAHLGHGLPLRSTPQSYPHNINGPVPEGWQDGKLYAAVPALALIITAVGLLIGCTWCYRHKDCKLFTASATHLHERRSHPPDSGFSEPANNNISEDNNNGPISLREMQNIANNNAAAYIVSENEERNRVSRESVVEFEPLPTGIRVADPLERCVDWFGDEDFPRNRLQYLREIGRGWFGRVVEGEIEDDGATTTVAVKILNQNASLEDKARFLDEALIYRDSSHENILAFVASCLQEDPWILIFELCSVDLQTYLTASRPNMAELNESGVPLRLMCDVTSALSYLHSRGLAYGYVCARNVLVRGEGAAVRGVLGSYGGEPRPQPPDQDAPAPHGASSDVHSLGTLIWEICAWGAPPPRAPPPDLNCPYREHLYQVMQLCWAANPDARPSAGQVQALLQHLYSTHAHDDGYGSSDFEDRWQRLKPNTIPKLDEHVAIVHAPSTSMTSHFTGSEEFDHPTVQDSLSADMDTAVSRSSSIMSDKDPLSVQVKSESLTNLHGSLDDVRNIYLTHNETAVLDCHQANIGLDDRDKEHDRSDASVDPWLKDIIAGSQDDVSYYRDVSDVIKNLDNILNSEKTSSSESSHQASPSRDNLSLDCKKDYPMQSSLVKSPGITNFQNILEIGFEDKSPEKKRDEDDDRDTIGTLSHSFERHSDTVSQQTLENLTPDTPVKDIDLPSEEITDADLRNKSLTVENTEKVKVDVDLPKENKIVNSDSEPNVADLCIAPVSSVNEAKNEANVCEDCQSPGDNNLTDIVSDKETVEAKSISEVIKEPIKSESVEEVIARNIQSLEQSSPVNVQSKEILPVVPDIVENDKIEVLLPSNTLDDKDATNSIPEPSSHNSQNEINNDLITPAESTTDSKITPVESVPHVTENPAPKVELIENVSELSNISTHSVVATEQGLLPLSLDEKGEESLPEKVQSVNLVFNKTENEIEKSEISVPYPQLKLNDSECKSKEIKTFLETDLPKYQFDQTMPIIDEVLKIVKEAEIAALSSIETALKEKRTLSPINNANANKSSSNTFLENEIKALKNDSTHYFSITPEVIPDILKETITAEAKSSGAFPKEILRDTPKETPIVGNCDKIAKGILIEALHDVSKAMDAVKTPEIYPEDDVEVLLKNETISTNLQNIPTQVLPEFIQDAEKFTEQTIIPKQKENEICAQEIASTQSVHPQKSLDLELTASVDSSQSTFLIKDTLSEECNTILNEEPKENLQEVLVQTNMDTEFAAKPEIVMELTVKTLSEDASKQQEHKQQQKNLLDVTDVLVPNLEKEVIAKDITEQNAHPGSDNKETNIAELSNNSTVYMDFTDDIKNKILKSHSMDENVKEVINSCFEDSATEGVCSLVKNESTVYLDLPNVIRKTDEFLHSERQLSSHVNADDPICSSTPKNSAEDTRKSDQDIADLLSETKVPDYGPGVTLTRLEQQCVPDSMSPFESPTKSHPTDTYDENSSVVLGPFENCTMELFKGVKSATDLVDIPKEELLAFSSNFSEINLETPSPLRDGNFLKEVPDISHDDVQFDDITSEPKDESDNKTDVSDATDQSVTEKRVSPSTPPNSPGYFLASTSQQKYLVDIDLNQPIEPVPIESDSGLSSLHKEIELNQIELQITSKLAMAENENNLNIEYSGPLTVEGLVQDDLQREEESVPETFLAGNGGCIENIRERFTLDEDCVNALRNELELKLPLAQVAAIEPQCESESEEGSWSELPPPPELIVSYPGALSPIAEETGPQLSAYENDAQWNTSARTDSSESYPEPCNNSTDEVTELPTGQHSGRETYTLQSHDTYTVQRDTSREITMSADSLNGSPRKSGVVDDRTFTKDADTDACERLSQVSPFVLSPTTDTSAPENSDVTGVSTLSKTTVPTDAKISKPSETQCLSKATSIDSWCSNDTLYNVEEAFDDLASDPDIPQDFDLDKELDNSDSSRTLTVNDEKELSRVSTYIVHDSHSDEDRFSPDSITANDNDNHTYTKAKTEFETSPSVLTKSEVNDSKTQTKDLAYGTLMSGAPSYSNCTTEAMSGDNTWMFPQPELVRRSPIDGRVNVSAPAETGSREIQSDHSPQLKDEPRIKKMDSVEISCLEDHLLESSPQNNGSVQTDIYDSPNYQYDIAVGVTSTPLAEPTPDDNVQPLPMTLLEEKRTPENLPNNIPNFQSFLYSAELRPQERSYGPTEGSQSVLLEADRTQASTSPSYWEFEIAATRKPQDTSRIQSSQNGSEEFRQFENSVRERPQDLSTTPSALLLLSEGHSADNEQVAPLETRAEPTPLIISPPSITNLRESHVANVNTIIITDLEEDETEQPHSIIIAEVSKESPNRTYDSHTVGELNLTYDSHTSRRQNNNEVKENISDNSKEITVNGIDDQSHDATNFDFKTPETKSPEEPKQKEQTVKNTDALRDVPNGSVPNLFHVNRAFEVKCNGNSEKFATVNFISEAFEELLESNVDDNDCKDKTNEDILELSKEDNILSPKETVETPAVKPEVSRKEINGVEEELVAVTEDFLQNEKNFCQLDAYFPLLSDIRFTGPASEIMSTSFTQDSPTEPETEREGKPSADMKEWDSDSDSHSSNSSSGEFIWKRGSSDGSRGSARAGARDGEGGEGGAARDSGSGSGSEGDEVEFVPSSWDCRAAPAKSSLRSLANSQDNKKRVVFKRQKYHCVYEYPRELAAGDADSPAYLPDLSTYTDWDPSSAEEAELGYGQLFAPAPLDLYPLRGTIAFGADYDEDFFISSSARPFESLGVMTTTSQFFPGMQLKPGLLAPLADDFPPEPLPTPTPTLTPAPTPTPTPTLAHTRTPSLDFTTPDSGVEDITPGSTSTDEDFKTKKLSEAEVSQWRSIDSGSSSESVSPSSPGGEALGGLRHTRDKLKLDLPPSPHIPSPRHNRVFNFVLDKPKRHRVPDEKPAETGTTPLVMTDETPIGSTSLPLPKVCEDIPVPEPTFSTFGKCSQKTDPEQKMILTDDVQPEQNCEVKAPSPAKVETVKGEGTVLDSGDEDSGIESSSKATLERNKTPNIS